MLWHERQLKRFPSETETNKLVFKIVNVKTMKLTNQFSYKPLNLGRKLVNQFMNDGDV